MSQSFDIQAATQVIGELGTAVFVLRVLTKPELKRLKQVKAHPSLPTSQSVYRCYKKSGYWNKIVLNLKVNFK